MPSLRENKGLVYLMVLSVVTLFTAMIVVFKSDQSMELELAYNFRDSLQSQYLGTAGIEAAISILAKNDNEYDFTDEEWGKFSEYMMVASSRLEGMTIQGEIIDECSKLDLNKLIRKKSGTDNEYEPDPFRINQLKKLMGKDILDIEISEQEFEELAQSICDWIDLDTEINQGGAESEYYRTLDEPYDCKDGPMDTPEEILLVKGMNKEWFYGTETYEGIGKFVTVGTSGLVNVNTASKEVLMSLATQIDESVAEKIIECRPIKKLDDFRSGKCDTGISIIEQTELNNLLNIVRVNSILFRVEVKGVMPSGAMVNTVAKLFVINNVPQIVYYKIY